MVERKKCRHCHENWINRPLGLCWHCYYTPGVRELYPSTSKFCPQRREGGRGVCEKQTPKPDRKPKEPHYRCLWCFRFRCEQPLKLCGECQEEYERLGQNMPAFSEDYNRDGSKKFTS